jgi:hypothetical protein
VKVIERKDRTKEFVYDCKCPQCESLLRADAGDLIYRANDYYDPRDEWYVMCPVCSSSIILLKDRIPEYLRERARVRRYMGLRSYFK